MLLANAAVLLVGLLAPAAQMPMPATLTLLVLVVLLVAPGLPKVAAAVAGTMAALIVDLLAGQDCPYVGQSWVTGFALRMLAFGLLALTVSAVVTRTTSRLSTRRGAAVTSPDWTTTPAEIAMTHVVAFLAVLAFFAVVLWGSEWWYGRRGGQGR